jgi:ATP-dependent DNA helicase RecG
MTPLHADSPIQYVKGVGPRRAELFATLGLRTVGELLEYLPFRYELDQGHVAIAELRPDVRATISGEVVHLRARPPGMAADVSDGSETCTLRWFQRLPGGPRLGLGALVIATGVPQLHGDRMEMVQPAVQVFQPDARVTPQTGRQRLVGVYPGNAHAGSAMIRRAVEAVLAHPRLPATEIVPIELLRKHGLPSREQALRTLHAPAGEHAANTARRRLAYEEFLLLELALALRRQQRLSRQAGHVLRVTPEIDRRIRARFPFPLTPSQDQVLADVRRDLESGRPMTRLLQGDVGSGKTVVALYACLTGVAHGRQAALMAPTEILARQHFHNLERYLEGSRVRRVFLHGGLPRAHRAAALRAVQQGDVDLVVGTQALVQRDVAFQKLAVVVVDEQHKFGVAQRAAVRTKGPAPHYLVMTATPIPRTLAMTVFGDLDVSVLRHAPPGRARTHTRVVTPTKWFDVMTHVRGRLEAGEQAYVVCPRIGDKGVDLPAPAEDRADVRSHSDGAAHAGPRMGPAAPLRQGKPADDGDDTLSAREVHERLARGPWQGLRVGLLHGSMPAERKAAAMDDFSAGRLHALVATTVVEVGLDVPAATIMIVEHAERFGLSQLHQLRGRVGRGSRESLCVLIARRGGAKSAERLGVMAQTSNGFHIAEADLRQRGPGELLGTRQHGLPELKFGDLVTDFELLEAARDDAFSIVSRDPALREPAHAAMHPALRRTFGTKLALIDAG